MRPQAPPPKPCTTFTKKHRELKIKKAEFKLNADKERVTLDVETKKQELKMHAGNEKAKVVIEAEMERLTRDIDNFKKK